jgi:hypothetical protein
VSTQKKTIEHAQQHRRCGYMLAMLRRIEQLWPNSEGPDGLLKIATLGFVGNAIVLSREVLSAIDRPIVSTLLLRTLWHNAGQLAWLLVGPGELLRRLEAYETDHSIRADGALIARPRRMFGKSVTVAQFEANGQTADAALIESEARDAVERRKQADDALLWSRIGTADLWKALRASFQTVSSMLQEPRLDVFLRFSQEAVEGGDDVAHPNPFVILTVLDLVDIERQRLNRGIRAIDSDQQRGKVLSQLTGLLMMHCVAIAAYDAKFPLRRMLEVLSGSLDRSKAASEGSARDGCPSPQIRGPFVRLRERAGVFLRRLARICLGDAFRI